MQIHECFGAQRCKRVTSRASGAHHATPRSELLHQLLRHGGGSGAHVDGVILHAASSSLVMRSSSPMCWKMAWSADPPLQLVDHMTSGPHNHGQVLLQDQIR